MTKVELEVYYPCSMEKVWAALTEAQQLGAWYTRPEGFEPKTGTKFQLHSKPNVFYSGVAYCEVLAVNPPYRIQWSQSDRPDGPPTFTLTWTLQAEGEGTRLSLLQDGLEGLRGKMIGAFMSVGWKRILNGRLSLHLLKA